MNEMFKSLAFTKCVIKIMIIMVIPTKPKKDAEMMKRIRQNLVALMKSMSEKIRSHTDVTAMMITAKDETIPAFTAASPKTRAPTILIDVPINEGILISLSLNISNVRVKINISR